MVSFGLNAWAVASLVRVAGVWNGWGDSSTWGLESWNSEWDLFSSTWLAAGSLADDSALFYNDQTIFAGPLLWPTIIVAAIAVVALFASKRPWHVALGLLALAHVGLTTVFGVDPDISESFTSVGLAAVIPVVAAILLFIPSRG